MRLDERADSLDLPGESLDVEGPVQDFRSLILHVQPRGKPLRFRCLGGRPERLFGQVALGQCLWNAMGALFRFAAQDVQVSLAEGVAGHGQGLVVGIDGLVVTAQPHQDTAQAFADGAVGVRLAAAVQLFDQFDCLAVCGDGLLVGVPVPGPVSGGGEIGDRPRGVGAAGVVMGEQLAVFEALASLGMLQGGTSTAVQLAAARLEHAVVGDLAGQRVLEHEGAHGDAVALPEELQPLQLLQPLLQRHVAVPDLRGQVERELAAEHCGHLDSRLLVGAEPVDPRGQHLLDRLRYGDARRAGG